jgi:hypothetical protein
MSEWGALLAKVISDRAFASIPSAATWQTACRPVTAGSNLGRPQWGRPRASIASSAVWAVVAQRRRWGAGRRSAATVGRVPEEVSAMPTTGQVSGERSEVGNAARCHLPLCSFSLPLAFRASARNRGHLLLLHRGKRDVPIIHVPMTEPVGPAGGRGDMASLLPRKVGGGLSPWFRTKWHRGDKP